MKPLTYSHILDAAAAGPIPGTIDLTPQILARIQAEKGKPMQPKMKLATTILLAVLAALALSTAAYAVYRWITDPGLRSVQDAGLVTGLNITAQPTFLPTSTLRAPPGEATQLDISQTLEGITLTMDWAYLDEGRLALGMQSSPLPPEYALDAPAVAFVGITPLQAQGYSQGLRTQGDQSVYVSYQVIHANAVGGKVNLSVDVPLVRRAGEEQTPVANFHFELHDIPVYMGQTLSIQQTYAVRLNGVEVRLKSVRVMPSAAEVVACYDFPRADAPFWYMQNATLQIGNGPEEGYRSYQYLSEIQDDHCVKLGFAVGNAGGENRLVFRVHRLVVPLTMQDVLPAERIRAANQQLDPYGIEIKPAPAAQSEGPGGWQFVRKPDAGTDPAKDPTLLVVQALEEAMDGPWEFYADIPSDNLVPGQQEPTPVPTPSALGEQTIEGVSVTLDWAFADAKRVGVAFTIEGLPDTPEATALNGTVLIKDAQGNPVGGAGIGSSSITRLEDRPGVLKASFSVGFLEPLTVSEASFRLEITLDGSQANDIIAGFEIPPEATPYPPGVYPPRLPDRLIGSYIFDFTVPVYPLAVIGPQPAVTANGITMQIARAEVTASTTQVMLCFAKPSAKDWWIMSDVVLKNAAEEAHTQGGQLVMDTDVELPPRQGSRWAAAIPPEYQNLEHGRCLVLDFLLGSAGQSQPLSLVIPQLEQSPPEVVPDNELQAARQILSAQGIEIDYTTFSSASGGGGGGVIFKTLPEGMSQMEAFRKYTEALGYLYPGPWELTLPVQP